MRTLPAESQKRSCFDADFDGLYQFGREKMKLLRRPRSTVICVALSLAFHALGIALAGLISLAANATPADEFVLVCDGLTPPSYSSPPSRPSVENVLSESLQRRDSIVGLDMEAMIASQSAANGNALGWECQCRCECRCRCSCCCCGEPHLDRRRDDNLLADAAYRATQNVRPTIFPEPDWPLHEMNVDWNNPPKNSRCRF